MSSTASNIEFYIFSFIIPQVDGLKQELEKRKLTKSGTKAELQERLLNYITTHDIAGNDDDYIYRTTLSVRKTCLNVTDLIFVRRSYIETVSYTHLTLPTILLV